MFSSIIDRRHANLGFSLAALCAALLVSHARPAHAAPAAKLKVSSDLSLRLEVSGVTSENASITCHAGTAADRASATLSKSGSNSYTTRSVSYNQLLNNPPLSNSPRLDERSEKAARRRRPRTPSAGSGSMNAGNQSLEKFFDLLAEDEKVSCAIPSQQTGPKDEMLKPTVDFESTVMEPALSRNQPSMEWPRAYKLVWLKLENPGLCKLAGKDVTSSCGWFANESRAQVLDAGQTSEGTSGTPVAFEANFGKLKNQQDGTYDYRVTVRVKTCQYSARSPYGLIEGASTQLLRISGDCPLPGTTVRMVGSAGAEVAIDRDKSRYDYDIYEAGQSPDGLPDYELWLEHVPRQLPSATDWWLEDGKGTRLGQLRVNKWPGAPVRGHRIRYAFEELQSVAGGEPSTTSDNQRIAVVDPTFDILLDPEYQTQPERPTKPWGVVNDFYLDLPAADGSVWCAKGSKSVQIVSPDDALLSEGEFVAINDRRLSVRVRERHIGPVSVTMELHRKRSEEDSNPCPVPWSETDDMGLQAWYEPVVQVRADMELAGSARRESVPRGINDRVVLECTSRYSTKKKNKNNRVIAPANRSLEACKLEFRTFEADDGYVKAVAAIDEFVRTQRVVEQARRATAEETKQLSEWATELDEEAKGLSEEVQKLRQRAAGMKQQNAAPDEVTEVEMQAAAHDAALRDVTKQAEAIRKDAQERMHGAEEFQTEANEAKQRATALQTKDLENTLRGEQKAGLDEDEWQATAAHYRLKLAKLALFGPQSVIIEVESSIDATPKRFYWDLDAIRTTQSKSLRPLLPKNLSQPGNTISVTAKVHANRRSVAYRANTVAAVADAVDLTDDRYVFTARMVPRGRFSYQEPDSKYWRWLRYVGAGRIRTYFTIPVGVTGVRTPVSSRNLASSTSDKALERVSLRTGLLFVVEPWCYERRENLSPVPLKFSAGALWATGDNESFAPSLVAGVSLTQPLINEPTQFEPAFSLSLFYEWDTSNGGGRHLLALFSVDLFTVLSPKAQ